MLLWNLDPLHGLYNGTHMVIVNSTRHVLQCHGIQGGVDNIVLIPCMSLDANMDEFPVPLQHWQFPVQLAFSMTINKVHCILSGQSVKYVGLDLHIPIFFHRLLF
ncbi:hypothetical protein PAXRUDRAFT_76419, partial [Paxillus rubicundulus Ve08.2h10]